MEFKKLIHKIQKFLTRDIWIIELHQLSRLKRFIFKQIRFFYIVIKSFFDDKCPLRSAALTFGTIFSIVPFFALIFALSKSLGFQKTLDPLLLKKIMPGQEEVINNILIYIENTDLKALGYIGLIFLVWLVIYMLQMMEGTFNDIWGIRHGRSILKKFGDYFSIMVIVPSVLVIVSILNTILATNIYNLAVVDTKIVRFVAENVHSVLPYALSCFAFMGLYKYMPNINVNLKAAFFAGIIAGTIWQFLEWAYINFQVGVARYNAIYGAFAALPIFLAWVYISWMVLLLGAEISFAFQNGKNYVEAKISENTSFKLKELLVLNLMYAIAFSFEKSKSAAQTDEELACSLNAPVKLVRNILFILNEKGLLTETSKDERTFVYQPARALKDITTGDVLYALRSHGTEYIRIDESLSGGKLSEMLKKTKTFLLNSDLNKNFKELLEEK